MIMQVSCKLRIMNLANNRGGTVPLSPGAFSYGWVRLPVKEKFTKAEYDETQPDQF